MHYTKYINQIHLINRSSRTQNGSLSRKGPISRNFGCGCRMDNPCFDMLFRMLPQMPQRKDEIKIVPGTVDAHILPGLCRKHYPALQTGRTICQDGAGTLLVLQINFSRR